MSNSSPRFTRNLPRQLSAAAATWLWHWLRRPWLATIAGSFAAMLGAAAWRLPQLPGQLVDEQAAAAAWLVSTSTAYGIWGNAFLALGLFDVLRSPMLYLLMALLLPTVAAHLADQLGALRQQRSAQLLPAIATPTGAGTAIPLSTARPLYRWRGTIEASPEDVSTTLEALVEREFAAMSRVDVALNSPTPADLVVPADEVAAMLESATPAVENRLVGHLNAPLQYVRPFLMLGLLLSVAGAWVALAFGWQVTAPPLAPGAIFRSANRDIALHYAVSTASSKPTTLHASLQGANVSLPVTQVGQERIGPATLSVRPVFPAVWIASTNAEAVLALPGEVKLRPNLGLVFPDPGSEASILLPSENAGLRIVQRSGTDAFVLELYRSDVIQPVYRAELTTGGQLTIPFTEGDTELIISSLPGLLVEIRRLPGLWLIPLGIFLALIGTVAYLRQSRFVVLQIAPWSDDLTVVVVQADHPQTIAQVRSALATLTGPKPEQLPE